MSLISRASPLTRRWHLIYLKVRCRPGRYLEYSLFLSVSDLDFFSVEWECWMTLSLLNLVILNMLWLGSSLGFWRSIGQGAEYKENWVSGKSLLAQSQCWMLDEGTISTQLRSFEPSWARQLETEKSQGLERPRQSICLGELWSQTLGLQPLHGEKWMQKEVGVHRKCKGRGIAMWEFGSRLAWRNRIQKVSLEKES